MNKYFWIKGTGRTVHNGKSGQSMVEFAMILPLFVLFIIGIFDLGRAFFAFIAISNAAREGTRVASFWPGKATVDNIVIAVENELADAPTVNPSNPHSIKIECGSPPPPNTIYHEVTKATDYKLTTCLSMNPIRVTVTYQFEFILKFFIPSIGLQRSAEMLLP